MWSYPVPSERSKRGSVQQKEKGNYNDKGDRQEVGKYTELLPRTVTNLLFSSNNQHYTFSNWVHIGNVLWNLKS
jgi:hypothetical protein